MQILFSWSLINRFKWFYLVNVSSRSNSREKSEGRGNEEQPLGMAAVLGLCEPHEIHTGWEKAVGSAAVSSITSRTLPEKSLPLESYEISALSK